MPFLHLPDRWKKQPQYPVRLVNDRESVCGAWCFSADGLRNTHDGVYCPSISISSKVACQAGVGYAGNSVITLPDYSSRVSDAGRGTAILIYYGSQTYDGGLNAPWKLGTNVNSDHFPYSNGGYYSCAFSSNRWCNGASLPSSTALDVRVIAVKGNATNKKIIVGKEQTYANSDYGGFLLPSPATLLVSFYSKTGLAFILDTEIWSDGEIAQVVQDPFSVFVQKKRVLYFHSGPLPRGVVVKNGRPQLLTTGEEGDYPALRLSGGYLKAGATGRKLTVSDGQLTCNDSASV